MFLVFPLLVRKQCGSLNVRKLNFFLKKKENSKLIIARENEFFSLYVNHKVNHLVNHVDVYQFF